MKWMPTDKFCPIPIEGVVPPANPLTGNALWVVCICLIISIALCIAGMHIGRYFDIPRLTRGSFICLVSIVLAAVLYFTLPGFAQWILGAGCIGS